MRGLIFTWITCCVVLPGSVGGHERIALVIGNGKYESVAELKNPPSDAKAVATALAALDFQVTTIANADLSEMEDAVVAFRKSLKKGCVAAFFYAGHGLQVRGENFLVPVRAKIREEFQVKEKCYKLDQVLAALDDSEAALKIVILDCCRDNPFSRGWTRSSAHQGLASLNEIPEGTIVAFSTSPGKLALDGTGDNSPFTAQLVKSLNRRPAEGLEVTEVFREASRAVKQATGQVPWLNLEASLDKYFLWHSEAKTPSSTQTIPPTATASLDKPPGRKRAYFGSIPDFAAEGEGFAISGVTPNGPAQKAGLRGGDVIIKCGDRRITGVEDFTAALDTYQPGDRIKLMVRRGDDQLEIDVTLGAAPGRP